MYDHNSADERHLHRGSCYPSCCGEFLGIWGWHGLKAKAFGYSNCKNSEKMPKSGKGRDCYLRMTEEYNFCIKSKIFASVWGECNCAVVRTFFGIAFLWDWNENWPFPVLWPLLSFQICWHIEYSTFTVSFFRIWNSSTGFPSPPLAFYLVILPKAHLTSHSRMSGSRWVITPSWLSGSWTYFCLVLLCILATS